MIKYYMPILDLMFATSIIWAWKTIPKNIQKDKTVYVCGWRVGGVRVGV